MDFEDVTITAHAAERMEARGIQEQEVMGVLANPEQILLLRNGRIVAQAVRGRFLVRVIVDVDRTPPEIVTAYRTSKIEKYRN